MRKIHNLLEQIVARKTFLITVYIAAFIVTYYLFIRTPLGQLLDTYGMFSMHYLYVPLADATYSLLVNYYSYFFILFTALLILIMLWRKSYQEGIKALLIVLFSSVSTQLLKHYVLNRPSVGITYYIANSFPSGHTTTAASLAVAMLLIVSQDWRKKLLYPMTILVSLIGMTVVVARWHRGSDVIGAIFVVAFYSILFSNRTNAYKMKKGAVKHEFTHNKYSLTGIVISFFVLVVAAVMLRNYEITIGVGNINESLLSMSFHHTPLGVAIGISTFVQIIIFSYFMLIGVKNFNR